MNDTIRLHPEVAGFAAAVRARLSDLDADEIEELTGDLEADLQERVDDAGEVDLGDPAAYATELRTAAGLPPREAVDARPWYVKLRAAIERRAMGLEARLRGMPASSALLDFLIALRPAWWILRAWVAYQIAHMLYDTHSQGDVLPHSTRAWAILIVATIVSVQWGRGRWRDRRFIPAAVVAGSVAAVIGLPFAYDHASARPSASASASVAAWNGSGDWRDNGLRMNGRPVRNVFAYDAKGDPLAQVQLYDQGGKPLFVTDRKTWKWVSVPATLRTGQQAWNVFPLARVPRRDSKFDRTTGHRVAEPGVVPQVWELPMPHAPAILAIPSNDGNSDEGARQGDDAKAEDAPEHAADGRQGQN